MSCCHCQKQVPTPAAQKCLPEMVQSPRRFWVCWPYASPTEYMSLSDKAILQSAGVYSFNAKEVATSKVVAMFPGDLGLVGFNRDGRPCVATCCQASARVAGIAYREWLDANKPKGKN